MHWRHCAALFAALLSFVACTHAPAPSTSGGPRALAPGVFWLPGLFVAGAQPDGNSVLFDAPDGWVLVDTGRNAAQAQALIAHARGSGKPVTAIVNTHWHLDHIGGNAALRTAYPAARVIASAAIEDARGGFLARYRGQLEGELVKPALDDAQRTAYRRELAIIDNHEAQTPHVVIERAQQRALAGRPFTIGFEAHAVTAGDVWLFDPASRVLAAGDLVTLPTPLFDTACPAHWEHAFERLAAQPFEWLVPGHGAPMQRPQFERYRAAYGALLRCAATSTPKGACIDGWLRDASPLIAPGDQDLARSLLDHYVDRHLRAPNAASCR